MIQRYANISQFGTLKTVDFHFSPILFAKNIELLKRNQQAGFVDSYNAQA